MSINWNNIRPLENSQNEGFEELVCQLARKEQILNKSKFIRKGKPDAGVECFWILENNDEWAWQAKFFTTSLTATQWSEIDDSVKTVLDKHPHLKKYFIAIPNDPPDARISEQTSMLEKWNNHVTTWNGLATSKGLTVEFVPWWSSDLIERLQKPENAGLTYFWFNKEEFTDQWCKEQTELSITDLGKRYTPELNVKLEVVKIFNGQSRNKQFNLRIESLFDDLLIKGNKIIPKITELKNESVKIQELLTGIHSLFRNTNFKGIEKIAIESFISLLNETSETAEIINNYYIEEERKLVVKSNDDRYYKKFGYEISHVREFQNSLYNLDGFLTSIILKLANHPFLLLEGEAGIGKSHLLADIVSHRNSNKLISIFFLGQHFVTDEDPWTQIFKKNSIRCSVDEFLGSLNAKAQASGSRAIIFIDAVNEGRGKYFWNTNIKSFLSKIKNYDWLGLVLSVRTSYSKLMFPKDEITEDNIIRLTHYGFRDSEYEASKLFFNNYGIELPSVPLLHPEFHNPLFLKLFCEGLRKAGYSKIPDGLQGITSIINFFVDSINSVLSKPNRLEYPDNIKVVRKAIDSLISYKIDNKLRYISFEQAFLLVKKVSDEFNIKNGLLEELISEGLLSKNLFWITDKQNEDGIYLAYERFEDHITASFMLTKYSDLEKSFREGGELFPLVKDEHECYINKGLIEALTIQIPEKTGQEFYQFAPHAKDFLPVIECFVQSLLWRKTETTSEKLVSYVNSTVLSDHGTHHLFWETILSVTAIPGHYFNAYSLHRNLMKLDLAERDAKWTVYLKDQFYDDSAIKRLIDWSWNTNDKSYISEESIKLSSIALTWLHTSTNRKLRDSATKSLVCLLENRINILIELIKMFKDVNDPYVYERLFAVAYGCALRTDQKETLPMLSQYIFKTIFNVEGEIYPHILLRDYARGVIEYTSFLGYDLEFDIAKARPPYVSFWPENISSLEELKTKYDNDEYYHLWSSVMGFGDFSRYIIGTNSNMCDWTGFKKGEMPVDREDVYHNFKTELSEKQLKLLNNLDPIITKDDDKTDFGVEGAMVKYKIAVGRKSEIDLSKAMSQFKDSLSEILLNEYEKNIEPFLDHNQNILNTAKHFDLRIAQRIILSKTIELGWNPELHLEFDKKIGTGRGNTTPHERIGKKYQWIAYYEYMARLSDNFIKYDEGGSYDWKFEEYEGPWAPYDRDIDPSMIINKTGNYNEEEPEVFWWSKENYSNWDLSSKDWIEDADDLPNIGNILNVTDSNNEEWLILEGYPEWAESKKIGDEKWDKPHKRMWLHLRSYLVSENDFETMKDWAVQQDFMGGWMPESSSRYEVFSREYYRSPAYNYFNEKYYGGIEKREVFDKNTKQFVGEVIMTSNDFLWEAEFDKSKEYTISFIKPSNHIFKKMQLNYSKREGEFTDKDGRVICFAPSVYNDSKSYLLIKKKPFMIFLKENRLKIVWTILGEKNVIGGRRNKDEYNGRLEISGAFYLNENETIEGRINTKNT